MSTATATVAPVTPISFSTRQILNQAWQILKKNWAFLLGVIVLLYAVIFGLSYVLAVFKHFPALYMVIFFLNEAVAFLMSIGMIQILLKVVRGETPELKELFTGKAYLLQYFLVSLVVGLVAIFGYLLLIIPGIIWSIKYRFAPFLVVDENLQFSDAMEKSAQMTDGIKWKLFCFELVICGINLLGCIPLFLGLIITLPLSGLAMYVLYDQLKARLPKVAAKKLSAQS